MPPRSPTGPTTWRRLAMLATALCVGAVGWTLLGESETFSDDGPGALGEDVVARVEGIEVTGEELRREVAKELADLDQRRRRLLADALEHKVREALLEVEAERRGLDRDGLLAVEVEARLHEVPTEAVVAFLAAVHRDGLDGSRGAETLETQARRVLRFEALMRELKRRAEIDLLVPPGRVDALQTADLEDPRSLATAASAYPPSAGL